MVSNTSSNSQITECWRHSNEMVLGFSASPKIVSAMKATLIHLDHLLQLPGKGPHQTLCITALVLELAKKIHDFTYLYYWRIHTSAYS